MEKFYSGRDILLKEIIEHAFRSSDVPWHIQFDEQRTAFDLYDVLNKWTIGSVEWRSDGDDVVLIGRRYLGESPNRFEVVEMLEKEERASSSDEQQIEKAVQTLYGFIAGTYDPSAADS